MVLGDFEAWEVGKYQYQVTQLYPVTCFFIQILTFVFFSLRSDGLRLPFQPSLGPCLPFAKELITIKPEKVVLGLTINYKTPSLSRLQTLNNNIVCPE